MPLFFLARQSEYLSTSQPPVMDPNKLPRSAGMLIKPF
jgi:hypothetical protein